MRLSVIIPAYNEVATLKTVLDTVRRVPLEVEIIVVDGNSTDGTRAVLEQEAAAGDIVPYPSCAATGRRSRPAGRAPGVRTAGPRRPA